MTVNGTDWAENPVVGYTFTDNGEVMRRLFWITYHLHLETLLYLIILSNAVQLGWYNDETMNAAWVNLIQLMIQQRQIQ